MSTDWFVSRMELFQAAENEEWEEVKVRRPLEAVPSTECGPSRGVCMGLGQWTLDAVVARPIRPCRVESSSCVRRPSGNLGDACRRSSGKVRTPRSVTRALPCHIAESHNFSPPPSPAIAVSATFRSLPRLVDARAGSELARTPSPLGVLSAVNVYPKRSTLGACELFCFFGYRFGYWGTPVGPTFRTLARREQAWLHRAAHCGALRQSPNRPIARRIRRRRERPERLRVRRFRLRQIGR